MKSERAGGESKEGDRPNEVLTNESSSSASENEALKLQLSSVEHKLSEATASVNALQSSKIEIQKYADTLLEQLNEVEGKYSNQASLMTTKDEQILAAREGSLGT